MFLYSLVTLAVALSSAATSTSAPIERLVQENPGSSNVLNRSEYKPLRGSLEGAKWRVVSRKINFYDTTPESIRELLRRDFVEFDVLADPPVYPPGTTAADYAGVGVSAEGPFDLS
jgi:hypothetical protein